MTNVPTSPATLSELAQPMAVVIQMRSQCRLALMANGVCYEYPTQAQGGAPLWFKLLQMQTEADHVSLDSINPPEFSEQVGQVVHLRT